MEGFVYYTAEILVFVAFACGCVVVIGLMCAVAIKVLVHASGAATYVRYKRDKELFELWERGQITVEKEVEHFKQRWEEEHAKDQ